MSYTPINWQTGDTITAEKMNKMDNGWGVSNTQLFSETVTTEDTGEGFSAGDLSYSSFIEAESITVSFDGTDYTCPRIDAGGDSAYGGFDDGPDFTTYPFFIYSAADGGYNQILTQTDGSHTVQASASSLAVGDEFKSAVQTASADTFAEMDAYPYIMEIGVSTFSDVYTALAAGRSVYYKDYDQQYSAWTYGFVAYASFSDYSVGVIVFSPAGVGATTSVYRANSEDGLLA